MQKYTLRWVICGVLLTIVACSQQPFLAPTPTAIPPAPTKLPPAAKPLAIKPDSIPEIEVMFNNLAQEGLYNGAVMIAHQGEVVFSQGYGLANRAQKIPNTPQTQFRIGSITKQFTAMAILILQNQGALSVSAPICNYVMDCPEAWQDITIHHLLSHTSGIPNYTELGLDPTIGAIHRTPEEVMAFFNDLPLDFQPGKSWYYSNSGYIILGHVIEKVSGVSYETFLHENIFKPLHMDATGYLENAEGIAQGYVNLYTTQPVSFIDMSNAFAAGGLYSAVEDLYKWDQALFTEQLLPQAQVDQMFVPYVTIPNSDGRAYGYAWFLLENNGRPLMMHGGDIPGFTSMIIHYPEEQITIILSSNQDNVDMEIFWGALSEKIFGEE